MEAIYQLSPYAPVVIFIASILDIFFLTGFILYGAAMLGSVAMMYTTGIISAELIVISAYTGTLLGNTINFYTGKFFGDVAIVRNKLQHPRMQQIKNYLDGHNLWLYVFVCRFFTFSRPLYALLAGSLDISFKQFFTKELIVAFVWVSLWLVILIQGEATYSHYFG
jgi:membrane protein DedA with SNARE-associated domain